MNFTGGIQVRVGRQERMFGQSIWIHLLPAEGKVEVLQLVKYGEGPPLPEWVSFDSGADVPPTLNLDDQIIEALAVALNEVGPPPNTTMKEALDDSKAVRDRLLSLVEKTYPVQEVR